MQRDAASAAWVAATVVLLVLVVYLGLWTWSTELFRPIGPLETPTDMAPAEYGNVNGTCGVAALTYNLTLNPSASVSTSDFGVRIVLNGGKVVTLSEPSVFGSLGRNCDPVSSSGWYGVLWSPNGAPEAIFQQPSGNPEWSALPGIELPVEVPSGAEFEVVYGDGAPVQSGILECYGANRNNVVGSVTL